MCKCRCSYMAESGGAAEVLHLHMESAEGAASGVTVRATGLPRGRAAIDPSNFLFLQGGYTVVSAPPGLGAQVAGIDVLLDPQHEGKIYVGGQEEGALDSQALIQGERGGGGGSTPVFAD